MDAHRSAPRTPPSAGGDVSSSDARSAYAKALGKASISSGSISSALRSLADLHVLTKPAGSHGHYEFDDPMFCEWMRRLTWVLLPTSIRLTASP
jgi:hypothetical protein